MVPDPLLIYGAGGYTGKLIVAAAVASGLRPIVSGRRAESIEPVAAEYGLECRVAPLDTGASIAPLLDNVSVVILAAGPFSATAVPMVEACIDAGVHYLDLTGECLVFEQLSHYGNRARSRDIMLMPGCGFDVVTSDCLSLHVNQRLPDACHLAIGISGLTTATRGSLRTMAEQAGMPVMLRRHGTLSSIAPNTLRRQFDYGRGESWSSAVTWGDTITAFHTTGIPNIEVYFEDTPPLRAMLAAGRTFGTGLQTPAAQQWLKAQALLFPEGPDTAERHAHRCAVVAEARTADGRSAASRLRTPEAYSLSGATAVAIAKRVLAGDVEAGFQTPARVYGADFILGFDSVTREDFAVAA